MSKLYKSLAKICFVITAILGVHYVPDWWIHLLFAVFALFLVDFANSHSRTYTSLKWLQIAKEKFHEYRLKRDLNKAIKKEEHEKYRKKIIENALEKAKSVNESERKVGLEQLSQFGAEDNYVYDKLLELLKGELSKSHEKQIVETLCKIFNNAKNMENVNKW